MIGFQKMPIIIVTSKISTPKKKSIIKIKGTPIALWKLFSKEWQKPFECAILIY